MGDLVNIINNTNPVIAATILCLGVAIAVLKIKVKSIEKRIDEYDKLHIEATMSQITTDLAWIKSKLIELTQK